MELSALRYKRL